MRSLSENVTDTLSTVTIEQRAIWHTDSIHDSWDSIASLVDYCELSYEDDHELLKLSLGIWMLSSTSHLSHGNRIRFCDYKVIKQPNIARKSNRQLSRYKLLIVELAIDMTDVPPCRLHTCFTSMSGSPQEGC